MFVFFKLRLLSSMDFFYKLSVESGDAPSISFPLSALLAS